MKRVVLSAETIVAAKETSEGIFWVIDDQLLAYPFGSVDTVDGIAKSGNTYNHKRLWNDIKPAGSKYPYNHYPRGRVVINTQGKATIYMNPNIDQKIVNDIKVEFGFRESPRILYDNSDHYKCHLDEGWRPEK